MNIKELPNIDKNKTIACTGLPKLLNTKETEQELELMLEVFYKKGMDTILTGTRDGFEKLVCQTAFRLKQNGCTNLRLVILIHDFTVFRTKRSYYSWLQKNADQIILLENPDGIYFRNLVMLDNCGYSMIFRPNEDGKDQVTDHYLKLANYMEKAIFRVP